MEDTGVSRNGVHPINGAPTDPPEMPKGFRGHSPETLRVPRGAARIRTGDKGFAVLCLTTWPRRQKRDGGGQLRLPPPNHESGKPDSNRRPQPWQGCALPTELFPHAMRLPS